VDGLIARAEEKLILYYQDMLQAGSGFTVVSAMCHIDPQAKYWCSLLPAPEEPGLFLCEQRV
jgi:hypothetical protein